MVTDGWEDMILVLVSGIEMNNGCLTNFLYFRWLDRVSFGGLRCFDRIVQIGQVNYDDIFHDFHEFKARKWR